MSNLRGRWARPAAWLLLLSLALGLRVGVGFWWQSRRPVDQPFGFGDSLGYWRLGQALVRGEPYEFGGPEYRVFRTPGYPLLLAGLFALLGDDDPPVMWARGLSALCGVAAVGGVACLAWQLFDERIAWIAGWLSALYPGAIAISALVLSEAPFCPLMLLQLNGWVGAWRSSRRVQEVLLAVLAGVAAGGATLMRPSWLLFTPFALILALWGPHRFRHLRIGTWMLLGLVLTMMPWWIRNYQVVGRFVPTSLQVGASLYDGLNPEATGASDMRFVEAFYRRQKRADAQFDGQPPGTFEERLDRRLRDAALAWAAEHPGRVARLVLIKFLRIWNPLPNADELPSRWVRLGILAGYLPLLLAGLVGVWKFARRDWAFALCYLPAVYLTLLHVIFVASIRYRQPAMLPICAVAAGVLVAAWPNCRAAWRNCRVGRSA